MYSSPIFCIEEGNKGYGFFRTDLNAVSLFYLFLITVDLPDCVSFFFFPDSLPLQFITRYQI